MSQKSNIISKNDSFKLKIPSNSLQIESSDGNISNIALFHVATFDDDFHVIEDDACQIDDNHPSDNRNIFISSPQYALQDDGLEVDRGHDSWFPDNFGVNLPSNGNVRENMYSSTNLDKSSGHDRHELSNNSSSSPSKANNPNSNPPSIQTNNSSVNISAPLQHKGSRRSFTVTEKLSILEEARTLGFNHVTRKYHIQGTQVTKWRRNEEALKKLAEKNTPSCRVLSIPRELGRFPELEAFVYRKYIEAIKTHPGKVAMQLCQNWAKQASKTQEFQNLYGAEKLKTARFGSAWLASFKKHYLSQPIPDANPLKQRDKFGKFLPLLHTIDVSNTASDNILQYSESVLPSNSYLPSNSRDDNEVEEEVSDSDAGAAVGQIVIGAMGSTAGHHFGDGVSIAGAISWGTNDGRYLPNISTTTPSHWNVLGTSWKIPTNNQNNQIIDDNESIINESNKRARIEKDLSDQ